MELFLRCMEETVTDAVTAMRLVSGLCDMLSGLSERHSNIPANSFCETMELIQSVLDHHMNELDRISWPKRPGGAV